MLAVKAFQREVELYPPVLKLFGSRARVFGEVSYYSKHVDLIFSSNKLRYLLAVELKLRDWRRGLKQAALNQVFCELSYLAMPSYVLDRLDARRLDIFRRHEVGLISVMEDRAAVVISPVRTEFFRRERSEMVKTLLRAAPVSGVGEIVWVGRSIK